MKIRFWDRLVLFAGALLALAAGAFLAVCGLQITGALGEALSMPVRIACIAGGILLVAFSVYLLLFPRKYAAGRHSFIVQQTDNGEMRIAVKAIENLVQKCVDMHEEISLNSMKIRNAREGVTVDMNISLANNISIPLAVASLQKQIKQYLVASSGIEVKEVRVTVDTTSGEATEAPDSPYLMGDEQEPAQQERPAAEQNGREKVPLHQRLFGRQDQAAIMPEPPKAEAPAAEAEAEAPAAPAAETEAPVPAEEEKAPAEAEEAPIPAEAEEEAALETPAQKAPAEEEATQEAAPAQAEEEGAQAPEAEKEKEQ